MSNSKSTKLDSRLKQDLQSKLTSEIELLALTYHSFIIMKTKFFGCCHCWNAFRGMWFEDQIFGCYHFGLQLVEIDKLILEIVII